jgi:hypothetical protein
MVSRFNELRGVDSVRASRRASKSVVTSFGTAIFKTNERDKHKIALGDARGTEEPLTVGVLLLADICLDPPKLSSFPPRLDTDSFAKYGHDHNCPKEFSVNAWMHSPDSLFLMTVLFVSSRNLLF